MRVLIYEPEKSGHRSEYLRHLIEFTRNEGDARIRPIYVVHPRFSESFPAIQKQVDEDVNQSLVEIRPECHENCQSARWLAKRSILEWEVVRHYAHEFDVDHCVLLSLNPFQYALGLPSVQNLSFDVSGILFHPYIRIRATDGRPWARMTAYFQRLRKHLGLKWMLRNQHLKCVHVLNDKEAVKDLNGKKGLRSIFSMLPDPVPRPAKSATHSFNLRRRYDIGPDRTVFLIFGALRKNKGVFQAVRAFRRLDRDLQAEAALVLMGAVKDNISLRLHDMIETGQSKTDAIKIVLDDRFVPEQEAFEAFEQCDVVLLPYQRTEGSTGVLGHAARARKPVIGPDSGLVGFLIEQYGLGQTTSCTDPSAIAKTVGAVLSSGIAVESDKLDRYLDERTPGIFASCVLDCR